MNSERLRQLVDTQGPFASIYFEDSHDTQDAAAQLDVKWHDIRKELEDQGADAALVSGLERAILDLRPPVGRSGRGVVAGAHGVLLNEHLIRSPASTVVRVSELPYVVPLIELGAEHAAYMVVAVDHVGADVALHRAGAVRSETVDAGAYPVHKTPAAGLRGYGDPQHRVDEAVRKNVRAVADRLTELEDESRAEVVFVVGQDRSRAELISYLPERVASRVVELHVGVRHTGIDDDDVRRAIDAEFERRRLTMFGAAAERFRGEKLRESGLAVEGLARVCAALREGAVETLISATSGTKRCSRVTIS